jgi:NADH:ubiquinone oxidoreductase subunit F (NADH-binding)
MSANAAPMTAAPQFPRLLGRFEPLATPPRGRKARRELIEAVAASGLTGRGGAGFPTAIKLRAVADSRVRTVVVANGVEGEPPSAKDRFLVAQNPHLVLDGAVAAAAAVGARDVVIALAEGAEHARTRMAAAIEARRSSAQVRFQLVTAPDRFVAGEESALVQLLNGGPAKPTFVPPRPFERGVDGRPTLVQNVETLANIGLIARFGPAWFRELGTGAEPGTVLVTVSGAVRDPGVYEVELGTPLRQIIQLCGDAPSSVAAVLVGGYFGSWLGARELDSPLSEAGLRPAGARPGARALVVLGADSCPVVETARALRYLADESAGQCGPCTFGLPAMADAALSLARRQAQPRIVERLRTLAGLVDGRGACAHPDGAANLLRSALKRFPAEIDLHLQGRCSAAVAQ